MNAICCALRSNQITIQMQKPTASGDYMRSVATTCVYTLGRSPQIVCFAPPIVADDTKRECVWVNPRNRKPQKYFKCRTPIRRKPSHKQLYFICWCGFAFNPGPSAVAIYIYFFNLCCWLVFHISHTLDLFRWPRSNIIFAMMCKIPTLPASAKHNVDWQ